MVGVGAKFECTVSLEDKTNCTVFLRHCDKTQHINEMVSKMIQKISLTNSEDKCHKSRCLCG